MYHKLTVLGRLGKDPELRYTPSEKAVANITVAVTEKWGDDEKTIWYRATAWGKRAEVINQYFKKGDMILLVGRPGEPSAWTPRDGGDPRAQNEFTIDEFSFVGGARSSGNGNASQPASSSEEDLGNVFPEEEIPF